MKKSRASYFFLFLLMISMLQLTSAIDTKIKVTTYANHNISIDFLTTSPVKLIKTMKMSSGAGEVSFVYSSTESVFNMNAFVFNNGEQVINSRFDDNTAGEPVHLILFPTNKTLIKGEEEIPANTTNNQTNTSQENTVLSTPSINQSGNSTLNDQIEKKPSVTGSVTEGEGISSVLSGKTLYYIGGIILILIIIIAFISIKKRSLPKEVKVRKLSEVREERSEDYKKIAEQAEKKAEEMQRELNRYKNQDKIKQIEARVRQEQEEIRRLRRGY